MQLDKMYYWDQYQIVSSGTDPPLANDNPTIFYSPQNTSKP